MRLTNLAKSSSVAILLFFISFKSFAQPLANFSATPLSGCAPVVVNFTDLSTGNPTSWRWDLGNSTISFLQNPSVTYFNPGQYTVKLVVQNAVGRDSLIRTQYITVFAKPTVNFTASTVAGCFPMTVNFTDASIAGSGTIDTWQWDFGDGTFSTQQNPSHTYTSAGNFNVSLRVRNTSGCFQTLTRTQLISVINGATANFTYSTPSSCAPPVSINFQNTSTGSGALTYQWNFGDGNTSTATSPSHNYTTAGTFTVQLIVTNANGCRDTLIHPNPIVIGSAQTSFTMPADACVNTIIPISNTSTTAVTSFWDFGDGTTSTSVSPVKIFTAAGTYDVKLVNDFGGCADSVTHTILIRPAPRAAFNGSPVSSCSLPLTVNFNNNTSGATTYEWNFGDGTTSTQTDPVHTYTNEGNFTVTLIASNSAGCSDTLIRNQYINIQLPQAAINDLPQEGCAPLSVTFSSSVTSPEPVVSYLWDFGDGNTSTQQNPTHVFGVGVFDITLIITTASGCSDTVIVTNGVRAGNRPQVAFTATPRDVCAEMAVLFTDLTTPVGVVNGWLWSFGDGGSSILQNPEHTYTDTGYFPVTLIAFHNGCPDTLVIPDYIRVLPPIARFTTVSSCTSKLTRAFTDRSIGADTWSWNFGDGNTSTLQNPVHTYAAPGAYVVSLTVFNVTTGCSFTQEINVRIIDEQADFTASPTTLCKGNTTTFTAIGHNPLNVASFRWNFGDGTFGSNPIVIKRYNNSGIYDVSLILTDINGCRDTLVRQQYITVNGPTANFASSVPGTCLLSSISFTDSSFSDGRNPIVRWIWNYGDGVIDTLTAGPFQHTYSAPGVYTVTLTVTDSSGCSHSITRPNILTISQPQANFTTVDTVTCPNRNVNFVSTSTGPGLTYSWNFGDGNTSTLQNPVHSYTSDGNFSVKLVIVDMFGCTDSITRTNYVSIRTPIANFSVSDSVGTCPPLIVDFTNSSQNYISLLWDFGDGTTSTSPNPSHFYSIPGTYVSTLTVTSNGGCTSFKEQTIVVRGPYGSFTYGGLSGCKPMVVNFVATTRDRISFIWDFNDGSTAATTDSIISHAYTIPGEYLPKMILRDAAGCVVPIEGTDTIRIYGIETAFDFNSTALCDQGSIQFNNTSTGNDVIASYEWNFGDGQTSTLENPSHQYTSPGTYYTTLITTSQIGCRDSLTSTVPVRIVATPQGQITQSANGCVNLTVNFSGSLTAADSSALTWQWNFGNGNTSDSMVPLPQSYNTAGSYPVTLWITNADGCRDTITTNVEAYAIPVVDAGLDTMICQGRGVTINATGATTYQWTPSIGLSCADCPSPVATPDLVTTYHLTGTSSFGCSNQDSITVSVKYPFNMVNNPGDTLCVGQSMRLFASGAHSYSWTPVTGLDNPTAASPLATPAVTTNYRVIGTDDRNCFYDTAFVPVVVYNIPTVEAGPDRTINSGQTITLMPTISADVIEARWSPTSGNFRDIFPGITVRPRQTTTYEVIVSNRGGCTASDNLTVYVICNNANIFIPNTFSPNGDGMNDLFYPRGSGVFSIKSMKIFNRWGEVMFEQNNFKANDEMKAWNGTFKGRKLNPDVYVYVVEVLCDNNEGITFKGNVALIK